MCLMSRAISEHRNETSLVNLQVVSDDGGGEQLQQVIHGRDYKLRAFFSRPDGEREYAYMYEQIMSNV